MIKRRRLIIDPRVQLKKTVLFALAILLLSGAVTAALAYLTYRNNAQLSKLIVEQNTYDNSQTDLYKSFIYISTNKNASYKVSIDQVEKDMKANSDKIAETVKELNTLRQSNKRLVKIIIGCAALQLLLIIYLSLRITSGVAGQMKLLGRYLDELNAGRVPHIRPLRRGDDFDHIFKKLDMHVKQLKRK